MRKFEVGERVSVAHGEEIFRGVIAGIWFTADKATHVSVTLDGNTLADKFHIRQLRKLKLKPKKKKHRVGGWVNVYEDGPRSNWHKTEEAANCVAFQSRIACAKVTIEWES